MHPIQNALAKFWAPVPWLLEAAIVLQVVLHKYIEAAVIGGLLIFNAALAAIQEGRTQATLDALKSRLALNASVKRDGIKLVGGSLVRTSGAFEASGAGDQFQSRGAGFYPAPPFLLDSVHGPVCKRRR
jgi:hypothetical protein